VTDPQIEIRRAGERFVSAVPGLVSRHSFAFGEHYDPTNVGLGPLMVSNEDVIEIARGYDDHPHRDAEIVTWVLSGSLHHRDSHGNQGLVYPRLAQRMSAGAGIVHAERNDGYRLDPTTPAEPVHFVQMWVRPDTSGGPPGYEQAEISEAALATDWVPVASGADADRAITIGTAGATLWVTTMQPGDRRRLPTADLLHLFVARGVIELEGAGALGPGDAVRIRGQAGLDLTCEAAAELLVWAL
jgi:quercetin 2,3-dioxygenase